MKSKPCNIVLLPGADITTRAIELSKSMQSDKTFFTLKDGECYPHVSIYMLELKVDNYEKVKQLVKGIAQLFQPFELTAQKYDQRMGFIDAEYTISPRLSLLQDSVVTALNPERNGMREKDKRRMKLAEGIKKKYFEQYGYPNVYELFRPHLTFTRFTSEESYDTALLPTIQEFSGTFDKLGFFESGENGTCRKLIYSYPFS